MSFFGLNFGQNADVDIILDNQDERKMAEIKDENGRKERLFLFYDGESVAGKVNVTLHRKTNRLEHQGIKIEFIGQIELYYDRGNHHEFLSLVKELARPGDLTQNTSFEFEFNQVEKPYECYTGANVRLRYFLRVTIVRRLTDMTKELDLLVHTLATYPEMNNPIKMEVGIEECLHIEFEYNKSKYHLKDVIVGKIYFLLVRIKIRHMEVAIIKRETTGSGPNTFHDNETIAKYEIMDGAPVKGESIPIRVFLAGYDLTPTMRDVNKKFSVRYYLNLVLVDEEERRYFKQQEITLWRKGERVRKSLLLQQPAGYQIPHAMARHNPGDYPTANVRTAPTPSEPNTPVSDHHPNLVPPLPGSNLYNHAEGTIPEEEESSSGPSSERVLEPRPEPKSETVPKTDSEGMNSNVADEKSPLDSNGDEKPVEKPLESVLEEESREESDVGESAVAKSESESVQKNENDVSKSSQPEVEEEEEEEDRPLPPDDDSVPDLDDSLIQPAAARTDAVVDNDEDDL